MSGPALVAAPPQDAKSAVSNPSTATQGRRHPPLDRTPTVWHCVPERERVRLQPTSRRALLVRDMAAEAGRDAGVSSVQSGLGLGVVSPEQRLEAEGIALRPFRVHDAAAVAAACRDPAILRFTFMPDGLTEADAVEWIEVGNKRWADGHARFAIVHPDDDRLLGQVGLNVNARHVSAEGYYWVNASERQRGLASRALGLVADWGFSHGIERLFLVIHPENVASNRLAERMGFTREGVLRSYEPVKGQRPDLVSWSLLPADPRPWHRQT